MSIIAGQTALASDFVASSAGSGDAGKVPMLDASGLLDNSFLGLTGIIVPTMRRSIPTGWLLCDGQAVSRATYSALFDVLCPFAVFTVTIASPAVFTTTAHGLVAGDKIRITTTGSLPTGLATGTDYYVIAAGLSANDFRVSTSRGGAAVNTSGSQSGVHTWRVFNSGVGDGSTTFNLPNLKGKSVFGYDVTDANFDTLNTPNAYIGEKTHQLTAAELPSHSHTISGYRVLGGSGGGTVGSSGINLTFNGATDAIGSDTAHTNMPPYLVVNFMVRI